MLQTSTELFLSILDLHAPLKTKRVRNKKSPWMTIELRKDMNRRDKQKSIATATNSKENWNSYRLMKNRVNNQITQAKKQYYKSCFSKSTKNTKQTWETIKEILSRKTKRSSYITSIKVDGTVISNDSAKIAEAFNKHFSQIGTKLADSIPEGQYAFNECLRRSHLTFSLRHTTVEEISKTLKSKATGLDGIPSYFIKLASPITSQSLMKILLNHSIDKGIFPKGLKLAKVTRIYKANDRDDLHNYRPISVLSCVAKIFERIVFNQLYEYLNSK